MLALVPMTEDEFSTFFEAVAASHAEDNIAAGRWTASDALALSREETKRLLPRNEKTSENYLFVLQDCDLQSEIGYLWFGNTTRATKKVAYLHQIYIHPRFRRQGYGRQAMYAFEKETLSRGYDGLALHVFATNGGAHRLYQALGYSASSITMRKELRPSDA
jgi:ribosomal protein S18 acetylase RimI-like enzyme